MSDITTPVTFNISVGEFSGSLETLLEMVQKRKMHISDVSLAQVADDYIEYVRGLGGAHSKETASFIVIAATLLLIKSKSLLPTLDLTEDEEESIKDLEQRLGLYSIYKRASTVLAEHLKLGKPLQAPRQGLGADAGVGTCVFVAADNLSITNLSSAIQDVLQQLPTVEDKQEASIQSAVNIEDVMQSLLQRVQQSVQTSFNNSTTGSKADILVEFLALLELIKNGTLLAEQSSAYSEIVVLEKS